MTMKEASERYQIPVKILKEYESFGLGGAVKKMMGGGRTGYRYFLSSEISKVRQSQFKKR